MDRETDRAPRVGDAAGNCLADPPCRVRRELESLPPVELLDGVDQPEVSLLDQVEKWQSRRLVLLRDRHDEAEVRLDKGALGFVAALNEPCELPTTPRGERRLRRRVASGLRSRFDCLSESCLVVLGQERILADVVEVDPDEILLVAL